MSDSFTEAKPPPPHAESEPSAAPRERAGEAKTRQILDGARRVFLRDGFDGASMNDVAREAGVSKGTLYVYFPSKEALFAAYIRQDRRRQAEQMIPYGGREAFDVTLHDIAMNFLREMLAPLHVAQIRTVVAAAAKFPEIGQAFYEAGPAYGHQRIAALLAQRGNDASLSVEDPDEAAVCFANLVQGDLLKRALFRSESPSPEAIEAAVSRGVAQFLRLYRSREPR